jgi:hypothetical protein
MKDTPVAQREQASVPARLALALSAAMTPALVATAAMVLIAWRFESGWRAAGYFGVMVAFGTVFGMGLAVVRARTKGVADMHIHERRDRPPFFAACAAAAAVGWGVLLASKAPTGLLVFMGAYGVCLGVIALTTLVSKPSVHCATMAAFAGALLIVQPVAAPAATVALAALTWARLYRKRHTLWQCVFGIAIGAAIVAAAYLVWQRLA